MSTSGRPSDPSAAAVPPPALPDDRPHAPGHSQLHPQFHEASHLILESAGDGIYGLDLQGFVTFVNPAAQRMTQFTPEDFRARTQHSLVHHTHPDGYPYDRRDCPIYSSLRDGLVHQRSDEIFWRKDGTSFPVAYTSTPILVGGLPAGAVVVFRDISGQIRESAWKQTENEILTSIIHQEPLERSLALLVDGFRAVFPHLALAIHSRSGDRLALEAQAGLPDALALQLASLPLDPTSQSAQPWTGQLPARSLQAGPPRIDDLAHPVELWASPLCCRENSLLGAIACFGAPATVLQPAQRALLEGAARFALLAFEHSTLQQRLLHQLQHDYLTGLPNRLLMEDRLQQALLAADRHGTFVGVCYIDVDHFKQINDASGHQIGDEFLRRVTQRFASICRKHDTLARQGGDEFILVLPDLPHPGDAAEIANRLLDALHQPFALGQETFTPTASIGVSVYPSDGASMAVLIQNADAALYAAKRAGRDQVHVYGASLGEEARSRARVHANLQKALALGQFRLAYQPMYTFDRQLRGFEALLRWDHPEQGPIPPGAFISIAEETGIIVPIGIWALHQACRQAAAWQLPGRPPVHVAVNVSGVQLGRTNFAAEVALALERSGLPPRLLELEITETWIVADPAAAAAHLRTLRGLGITLSIDDFGTAHSSLSYLHELPLDTLKIDRSFVSRLDGTPRNLATVRALVTLAQQLGLRTVAEGVETEAQLQELTGLHCDLLQGFLMAHPLTVHAATELLRQADPQPLTEAAPAAALPARL